MPDVHARPNILLVHWHDLGRHLAMYGVRSVQSPTLDRLAAGGLRFDRAFCTAPLCSPARGSLFTGRYPHANGLMGLAHLGWEYAPGEQTLPVLLRAAGYHTVLAGLQHESLDPHTVGFDEVVAPGGPLSAAAHCGPVTDAPQCVGNDVEVDVGITGHHQTGAPRRQAGGAGLRSSSEAACAEGACTIGRSEWPAAWSHPGHQARMGYWASHIE